MFLESIRQFDEAQVLNRLLKLFGYVDAGNGTPLAAALATALTRDASATRHALADILALDDETLAYAASHLLHALMNGKHQFQLPFGTEVSNYEPGGVSIGGEELVLDAAREGLFPLQATRRDAHGPNLDLLRSLIRKKTRKLACRRLGLPSPKTIVDSDERTTLQFPPLPEAGGIVLQFRTGSSGAPRFCSATKAQLETFSDTIVQDMRALWKRRAAIGRHADLVRRAAEGGILAECGPDADIKVTNVALELTSQREDEVPSVYVEYECLDECLRLGTAIDYLPTRNEPIPANLRNRPRTERQRRADLDELMSAGATGRIDEMAAAIISAAPEGPASVLAILQNGHEAFVTIPTSVAPLFATLYWRNGTIVAEADCRGRLDYCRERLELRGVELPETIVDTIAGRPLSQIADLPFACESRVDRVGEHDEALVLHLAVDTLLVNCVERRIWPEPAGADFGRAWMNLPPPFDAR